ncbi:hypothetical protein CYMTET_31822 [Cymbomonas tetramitiformis]|uniref:Uncharacterized protein n=1 Tax=Cymbomonas tetramitiformis TaxID=36881 RepID=A0AAE0FG23_9CHLO|nr:hypothetical protein CYMTET_31822 [Cymbomonas tetramitiformis]
MSISVQEIPDKQGIGNLIEFPEFGCAEDSSVNDSQVRNMKTRNGRSFGWSSNSDETNEICLEVAKNENRKYDDYGKGQESKKITERKIRYNRVQRQLYTVKRLRELTDEMKHMENERDLCTKNQVDLEETRKTLETELKACQKEMDNLQKGFKDVEELCTKYKVAQAFNHLKDGNDVGRLNNKEGDIVSTKKPPKDNAAPANSQGDKTKSKEKVTTDLPEVALTAENASSAKAQGDEANGEEKETVAKGSSEVAPTEKNASSAKAQRDKAKGKKKDTATASLPEGMPTADDIVEKPKKTLTAEQQIEMQTGKKYNKKMLELYEKIVLRDIRKYEEYQSANSVVKKNLLKTYIENNRNDKLRAAIRETLLSEEYQSADFKGQRALLDKNTESSDNNELKNEI